MNTHPPAWVTITSCRPAFVMIISWAALMAHLWAIRTGLDGVRRKLFGRKNDGRDDS